MNAINNLYRLVPAINYTDLSGGGATGDIISMKNFEHVDVVIHIGQTAGATTAVTLHKGNSVSSAATTLAFTNYYSTGKILAIESATGQFTVGETVTGGTSSATGVVYKDYGDKLVLYGCSTAAAGFSAAETITGGTSAYTATVTAAPTILDVMVPRTATSNTFNTAAVANMLYVIPIDAEMLGDGYDCIELNMADAGSSQTDGSALYLCFGGGMDELGGNSVIID